MTRLSAIFAVLFFINTVNAQEIFKEGYYIDVRGNKVVGLIDDEHWLNPPTAINFREDANSPAKTIEMASVLSFSVGGITYERYTFAIDKRPIHMPYEENSTNAAPDFLTITSFLKVLVKGQASLYSIFYNGDEKFFFTNQKDQTPSQLVYKEYVSNRGNEKKNNDFQKQLYNTLNCDGSGPEKYFKLKYDETALINFFSQYNGCAKSDFTVIKKEKKPIVFKIIPFAGISLISHSIGTNHGYTSFSSSTTTAPRFGTEIALVLPFNHNRYEVFSRISFEKFKVDNYTGQYIVTPTSYIVDHVETDATTIQFGFGLRYNMSINAKSKFYFDGNFGMDFASGDATYTVERHNTLGVQVDGRSDSKLKSSIYTAVGLGYVYNQKIGINLSADLIARDLMMGGSNIITSQTRGVSVTLRYTVN